MRTVGVLLLLTLTQASCGGGAADPPRSLLLVSIDTLRADHVGCYGYERPTTPHMDALAARSDRFESYWSVMPTTLPAHAAMFTSLHPRMVGAPANGRLVTPQAHTLAERLREHGFATGAFVSAVPLHPTFGLAQGFQVYDHAPAEERRGNKTRARAEAWLRERGNERFFAFVHLFDPHTWYDAPQPERDLFGAPAGPLPEERGFLERPGALDAAQRARLVDAYDAEVRFADAQVGALLALLEELHLSNSTVVVVTSDHGETLDELVEQHGYGYDHGKFLHGRELRVPLIVHDPRAPGPRVHEPAASQLDLLPTLLELLDVPREGLMLGRSLAPLLRGGALPPRPVFAERRAATIDDGAPALERILSGEEFAVAGEGWLLITGSARPEELYDLSADPRGGADVSAAHPDRCRELGEKVKTWREAQAVLESLGSQTEPEDVDPDLLEALRALGYATD